MFPQQFSSTMQSLVCNYNRDINLKQSFTSGILEGGGSEQEIYFFYEKNHFSKTRPSGRVPPNRIINHVSMTSKCALNMDGLH